MRPPHANWGTQAPSRDDTGSVPAEISVVPSFTSVLSRTQVRYSFRPIRRARSSTSVLCAGRIQEYIKHVRLGLEDPNQVQRHVRFHGCLVQLIDLVLYKHATNGTTLFFHLRMPTTRSEHYFCARRNVLAVTLNDRMTSCWDTSAALPWRAISQPQ